MSGSERCITSRCRLRISVSLSGTFLPRAIAHKAQCFEVIDRFEMILQRFAANRDPVLDHHPRFGGSQRVALDCI